MKEQFADLHVHTIFSDGTLTPEEALKEAEKAGLSAISLTDHDTAEVYSTGLFEKLQKESPAEIIPGIELSADYVRENGSSLEVHILAYYCDVLHSGMIKHFQEYQSMRYERALSMLDKLNKMGVHIHTDDLEEEVKKNIYGRLHIANIIIRKGYARSLRDVFSKYIGNGCLAYVPKKQKKLEELTALIRECGGLSVIAHPGPQGLEKEISGLKENGVEGIEVFHPDHSPSKTERLLTQAKDLSMLVTGGSDFHGSAKNDQPIGFAKIPYSYVELLKEASER